nr:MAG TPA: putative transcriptional regulator [Caudoviricetes sp.]
MIINNNIMEKTINERLVEVLKHLKENKLIYNEADFSQKTGISKSFLSDMKAARKEISERTVLNIADVFPDLNSGWLLTGEGEMIKKTIHNDVEAVPEDKYIMAEYADLRSFAGRLGGSDIEQLPETHKRLLPREYEKGNYLVVRVSGDSMNDGTSRSLCDGDEVLVRELAHSEWETLPIRNRLFIITSREGNVLKQIKEVNKEERYIVCHSFNTSFEDFTLSFDDIYQIFVIYKIVQKQIRLE